MAKLTYMDKKEIIRLYDEERYGYSRMCRKRTFTIKYIMIWYKKVTV